MILDHPFGDEDLVEAAIIGPHRLVDGLNFRPGGGKKVRHQDGLEPFLALKVHLHMAKSLSTNSRRILDVHSANTRRRKILRRKILVVEYFFAGEEFLI